MSAPQSGRSPSQTGTPVAGPEPAQVETEDAGVAFARQMWADDEASRRLGMEAVAIEQDHAVVTMTIRDDMVNKGIQPNAVTLKNPDFAAVARAYACAYAKPQKLAEIEPAIAAALAADRPTIIELTPRLLHK